MSQNTRNLRLSEGKKVTQSHRGLPEDLSSACLAAEPRGCMFCCQRSGTTEDWSAVQGRRLGDLRSPRFPMPAIPDFVLDLLGFCRVGPVSGFPLALRIDFLSMTGL